MEIGNIVKFKMFLPGNLAEIAGDDMALVQYRLAVAVQGEPGNHIDSRRRETVDSISGIRRRMRRHFAGSAVPSR